MIIVDASVWVSSFVESDAFHSRTLPWLRTILEAQETLALPASALAEVSAGVARRTEDTQQGLAATATRLELDAITWIPVDEVLARASATVAARTRLRGMDAIYVAVAQRFAAPLVTWEEEQLTRASSVISVRTPE